LDYTAQIRRYFLINFAFLGCVLFSCPLQAQDPILESSAPVSGEEPALKAESTDASNAIVSEIFFEGNLLTKSRSLEKKIKSRVKKPLDKKQLKEDVKILFETGDFDDVKVDVVYPGKKDSKGRVQARVLFHVVERPIVKRIDYKGDRKIRSSSFQEKLQSQEGSPFDRFKASIDERTILEYYKDEGYASARVDHYTTIDERTKKLILTFFIIEGERVSVKAVNITGASRFSQKYLRKKMKTRRKKVFKEITLQQDLDVLKALYRNKGHLDVILSSPSVRVDEERNEATIDLSVEEGPRYTIGQVSIASSTIFTPVELKKVVVLKKGKEFAQSKLDESVSNISGLYADKGYLRTEVTAHPERDREKGVVNYAIGIEESTIVYVDGVYVDGNTYTKTHVIKGVVLL
jgi:outer membrane protein insertion porin family